MHDLTSDQIQALLKEQLYGHLGCLTPDGEVYVVPVTFAYHGGAVYGFSNAGLKIDALRQHPSVCLQAEQFLEEGSWNSVILWGEFEELSGQERMDGMKILFDRLDREQGTATSPLYQPPAKQLTASASHNMKKKDAVFYRIRITRKTGKGIRTFDAAD